MYVTGRYIKTVSYSHVFVSHGELIRFESSHKNTKIKVFPCDFFQLIQMKQLFFSVIFV